MNIIKFINEDVWRIQEHSLNHYEAFGLHSLKILLLSAKGFIRDLCILRSTALALYTLLSIVPVFAMLFGVAKGFGFERILKEKLLEQVPEHDTMIVQLIGFAENMLENAKGGVVAGIGVIFLFWTVIKVIGFIEASFNAIWQIDSDRSLNRKLSDYLSLMFLAPILLIISSSITVFLKTHVGWLLEIMHLPDFGANLVLQLLGLSPLVIMSALLSFIYIYIPNHKVKLKPGLIAGILTAIAYQTFQWAYLTLQIGVSEYNAIYGSFAALPLFILSLQIGWMIVLFGCEIAFYLQNFTEFKEDKKYSEPSLIIQKASALKMMQLMIHAFTEEAPPLTEGEISKRLRLPVSVVRTVLKKLKNGGIIIELNREEDEETVFLPAVDSHRLDVARVIKTLEEYGQHKLPDIQGIADSLKLIEESEKLVESSKINTLVKDI
ncbi:MAG: YihY/virulence factor BrkB family protein [Gammaproteobacteria bacterium]|uniref:YhjD/YihY/BrkB family envelope integrity protein n=1 Tax=Methylotuvimicrobium sp. TaxID=2822413 RepID=UPI001DA6AAA2|nr:YihY/virulence factor BrkB family protein [Gammaproteobacteria bacterium]